VRPRSLRKALQHCLEHAHKERVWLARPVDVAGHCLSLPAGTIPGG
jgi:allantoinase